MGRHFPVSFFSFPRMLLAGAIAGIIFSTFNPLPDPPKPSSNVGAVISISQPFVFTFNTDGVLHESATMEESSSPYWWLNSGGKLIIADKVGKTIHGPLPFLDVWRIRYALSNPVDTGNGYYPQNIFRLVTKPTAANQRVEMLFKIEKDNLTASPNRNASNGILLMSRHVDSDNLYYAGVRVDGTAVIKKKYRGTYYTMAQEKVFPGTYAENKNLIPHRQWIGLRAENVRNADGTLTVRLFMKRANESWKKILEAKDDGRTHGNTPVISGTGHAGIRTDFMDVSFESFRFAAM
ncbi:hypothetical protein COU18_01745 [Candidatus Kaiserbacteria bacterium CG10_big_fil_rev_8_21_14_0_10_51_14]|uniref:3-keto-disaccharide hydrolase domain-containing protein n=1 Tax=Candidatus Kaiserbacteria bacterium CG10_big_fil_rev_8_21_14_0_10_51_14 TaxID=1974610 RepID=A0A2H0UE96_9BACT|nr:MAG: hypothetical protein COU18_01745 [Candidatus Kaiserbacteria bacterium CG10_big_fil_rev_8_21_14_0_10_51_14]